MAIRLEPTYIDIDSEGGLPSSVTERFPIKQANAGAVLILGVIGLATWYLLSKPRKKGKRSR